LEEEDKEEEEKGFIFHYNSHNVKRQ